MKNVIQWFGARSKTIAALVGAVLLWCQLIATQDGGFGSVTDLEWVGLAIAIATALGVYTATNGPGPVAKAEAVPPTANIPQGQ